MFEFFGSLLDTESFPARWYCGQWSPAHGWLHILSDLGTWSAYTAIPAVLAYFVLRRRDLPLPRIFWLFCAFIFSCGATHLIEAFIFWWPVYRLSGSMKLITAVISWVTVIALIRVAPVALRLPGLAKVNHELRLANADLDAFAHVVSHDLRAPLRGIHTLAGWIREDVRALPAPPGALEEKLRELEQRVAGMDALIDGVLQFARAGRVAPSGETLDTQAATEALVRDLAPPPGVSVEIHGPLPRVPMGATPFRQVMENLLGNATAHLGAPAGSVTVEAADMGSHWRFSVADDGQGIDPAHHEAIFELFRTVAPRPDGRVGGAGLAIVKRIVERHGGEVWVKSAPGSGATFYFTVPKEGPAWAGSAGAAHTIGEGGAA
jgi:signal transduction histidine kinase